MDLSESCNQRSLSPISKPIMEPLPVDNQFVVIFLCHGILTLHLETQEELGEVLLWFCSMYHNDRVVVKAAVTKKKYVFTISVLIPTAHVCKYTCTNLVLHASTDK